VVAAVALYRSLRTDGGGRAGMRRWLGLALAGALVAAAGWLMFVPAADVYSPLSPGLGNRTNAIAAIGIILAVYGCVALAGALVSRAAHRPWMSTVVAGSLALVLLLGYVLDVRDDLSAWREATDREDEALAALNRAVPSEHRPETAIYAFGYPGYQAPGVPIFATSWDLDGALKIRWNDPSVRGYPITEGATVSCERDGVQPVGSGWHAGHAAAYGGVVFVDIPTERAERINSAAQCRDAIGRFRPGRNVG
jgi:hypothetical protein